MTKVVVMPLIPAEKECGSVVRADLRYAAYGRATWEWWCRQHRVEFVVIDQPWGPGVFRGMSPSFSRWLAPREVMRRYGPDTMVAMVDADTMIHWDAPDIFDAAGGRLSAVRGMRPRWITRDLRAYQHLLPDVSLSWWDYFNAGIVVLGRAHLPVIDAFLDFASTRWPEIDAVQSSGRFGADQTPLNLIVRREGETVHFIPPAFNVLHCVPLSPFLRECEGGRRRHEQTITAFLQSERDLLDFVDFGHVWHFTNVVATRRVVMREVWRRVAPHYPGATVPDEQSCGAPISATGR